MIKHFEFLSIMIQAFFITTTGFIFVYCCDDFLDDIISSRKTLKKIKRGKRNLRGYTCLNCGFSAWALDHIVDTYCHHCGIAVRTKPIPKIERSFVCGKRRHSDELRFVKK